MVMAHIVMSYTVMASREVPSATRALCGYTVMAYVATKFDRQLVLCEAVPRQVAEKCTGTGEKLQDHCNSYVLYIL